MSRVILALLVLVAVANAFPNSPTRQCGENEQFTTCGTACEPTCGVPRSQICTLQCIIGCQCKEGYLRKPHSNECVHPNQC